MSAGRGVAEYIMKLGQALTSVVDGEFYVGVKSIVTAHGGW